MAGWKFIEYDGYGDINASTAAESFLERAVRDLATGVVREGIQNSLDARRADLPPDEPVRVRMTFALAGDATTFWFDGLLPHLQVPDVGAPEGPECEGDCELLLFEDFGTTGLTGDYRAPYIPGSRNNFVNFLYHEGVTGKRDKQRGSRGVGKVVFTMASRARTFFAYTIREDELDTPALVGKNVLKFRELNGASYGGAGYFVENWPLQGPREPVSDPAILNAFRKTFQVTRQPRQAGLSTVIPFLDQSITPETIRDAVIAEYHYAILARRLEVTIDDHGTTETINADHLPATSDEHIDQQVQLARWALSHAHPEQLVTVAPAPGSLQKLEPELVPDDVREALTTATDRGERVAVRIPIHVHPKDDAPQLSHFDIFLEHADDYANKPAFIRELLPVSSVQNAKSAAHVRALVVIDEGPLADLLRAAEGANHTDWSARTDRFKEHYRGRLGEIPCVAQSVASLMAIVRGDDEKPVGGIATRFFSAAPQNHQARPGKDHSGKGEESDDKGHPDEPPVAKPYSVHPVADGFVVRRTHAETTPCPSAISIRAAYDVIRGSAWGQWDPADFDFSAEAPTIRFETEHACVDVEGGKGNRFVVRPDADLFSVCVTGFDPNRDLIIDHRVATGGQ